jgi:hypothetical protein
MSDITDVFSRVAGENGDPAADIVDGDVARGHRALQQSQHRRRMRRTAIAATSVTAVAALIVAGAQLHGGGTKHTPTVATRHSSTKVANHPGTATTVTTKTKTHRPSIKLVAYHGKQLNGFTVDKVPTGWFLSTSTQYALLIDPAGSKDNDPDAFVGKLAVLLASSDETSFPKHGDHVTVNGQPGVIWDDGGVQLGYTDSAGHRVTIQVPNKLHWSDTEIVSFAEGVHVTSNALAGRG